MFSAQLNLFFGAYRKNKTFGIPTEFQQTVHEKVRLQKPKYSQAMEIVHERGRQTKPECQKYTQTNERKRKQQATRIKHKHRYQHLADYIFLVSLFCFWCCVCVFFFSRVSICHTIALIVVNSTTENGDVMKTRNSTKSYSWLGHIPVL